MKRITVAVHEKTYRQARVWAAENDISLSALVAWLLEMLPGIPRDARAFPPARNASTAEPASPSNQPAAGNPPASFA